MFADKCIMDSEIFYHAELYQQQNQIADLFKFVKMEKKSIKFCDTEMTETCTTPAVVRVYLI